MKIGGDLHGVPPYVSRKFGVDRTRNDQTAAKFGKTRSLPPSCSNLTADGAETSEMCRHIIPESLMEIRAELPARRKVLRRLVTKQAPPTVDLSRKAPQL